MLELLRESWEASQEALSREVGEGPWAAWLRDLKPMALERGVAYFEARTRMVGDRVQRLYAPLLSEVLSTEIGTQIHVELLAAPEVVAPDRLEVGPINPVVDSSNSTAYLVLKSLLEGKPLPGNLYLFHGPEGAGKTFLLKWWCALTRERPMTFDAKALTKAFQAVARDGRYNEFRSELSQLRPLVIDELHRVGGKRLQRELIEVLKRRQEQEIPTLLASRWHPREIHDLQPSLEGVLLSGFVSPVAHPGPAGRLRYLRALEGAPSRNGRKEDVEKLAEAVQGGYPELRRAWLLDRDQRPTAVKKRYLELYEPRSLFHRMRDRVCSSLQVAAEDLLGPSQVRRVSTARKILAWLCVQEGLSRAEVGRFMNNRTRAAISYLTRSLEQEMAKSPDVRAQVEALL